MIADAARIRLLQFLGNFAIGGTERNVMDLTAGFDRTRFDLHFGCLRRAGEYLAEVEARRIPVTDYEINRLYSPQTFRQQVRFAGYLRRHRIDIVHSYNFYANCFVIPAARLARTPVIVASVHDLGVYLTPLMRRVQQLAGRLAHRIVANSEAVRRYLIADGHDPDKIVVIPNPIDLARFGRAQAGASVRRELGVSRDAPVIAMLARVNRMKGVEYFIDAAAAVAPHFPDARFLVVGGILVMKDGAVAPNADYRSELEERIRRLGLEQHMVFTGFRRDVPELLSEVTVSVLPSLSEGLPTAVLESMATGLPVIATNVGGNAEAVEDGVSGLLVPPRDSAALAAAIRRVLEDHALAARLGQAARQRVAERFSLERAVRETERLYLTQLARSARSRARTAPFLEYAPGGTGHESEAMTGRPMVERTGDVKRFRGV